MEIKEIYCIPKNIYREIISSATTETQNKLQNFNIEHNLPSYIASDAELTSNSKNLDVEVTSTPSNLKNSPILESHPVLNQCENSIKKNDLNMANSEETENQLFEKVLNRITKLWEEKNLTSENTSSPTIEKCEKKDKNLETKIKKNINNSSKNNFLKNYNLIETFLTQYCDDDCKDTILTLLAKQIKIKQQLNNTTKKRLNTTKSKNLVSKTKCKKIRLIHCTKYHFKHGFIPSFLHQST